MKQVAIVDADAALLASSLSTIAEREQHDITYAAFVSPDALFGQLERDAPSLVLLHHNWDGVAVGQLLERIRSITTDVRVIVFTGREANIRELIECVRFGVCDYWLKSGSIDAVAWSRQIANYCSSGLFTLESLGRPSGAALGLARAAEANSGRLASLQTKCTALESDLAACRGGENREMWTSVLRIAEFVILAAVFVFVSSRSSAGYAVAFVILVSVFFLFLHQRISLAKFGWGRASATLGNEREK